MDEPGCDTQHQLVELPRDNLRRYFDDRLATMWLADRECALRTHEICNLDFSPIWDSQDPTGTHVRIFPAPDSTHVNVELRSLGNQAIRKLRYTLVQTADGWRIHDVEAPTKWSLVWLLARPR